MVKATKRNYQGLIKTIFVLLLVLLLLLFISKILDFVLGGSLGDIAMIFVLIIGILWLLSKDGQQKIKDILSEAGF